jgi:hypothetical protein
MSQSNWLRNVATRRSCSYVSMLYEIAREVVKMSLINMISAVVLTHANNCPVECDTKTVTCSESNFLIIQNGTDNFAAALLSRGSPLLPINVVLLCNHMLCSIGL